MQGTKTILKHSKVNLFPFTPQKKPTTYTKDVEKIANNDRRKNCALYEREEVMKE